MFEFHRFEVVAGCVYFSLLYPYSRIKEHCGPHNFKLRTQLSLSGEDGTYLIVSKKQKSHKVSKCMVFDDSFAHESINPTPYYRLVLIVDTWNQTLSEIEKEALVYVFPEYYSLK